MNSLPPLMKTLTKRYMATKIKSQGDSRKATSITPASSDIGPITERDGKLQLRLTVKPGAQTNSITEITHNAICIAYRHLPAMARLTRKC
ncbi:hypothetical protein BX661DRAFT_65585 [Kickxella alabastrina]|uniref:uncharacterized protein n=1 Tax=Kickxella alabastrina TaxID=61397 RepID=UPI00221F2FE9|nr:uncharacterized protein BX661DRAFT_65585 [Kickxella alabastrina]KAI7833817.1 hypothetical protein BX661DRAFT_65585 [Kickxella alabastrina]